MKNLSHIVLLAVFTLFLLITAQLSPVLAEESLSDIIANREGKISVELDLASIDIVSILHRDIYSQFDIQNPNPIFCHYGIGIKWGNNYSKLKLDFSLSDYTNNPFGNIYTKFYDEEGQLTGELLLIGYLRGRIFHASANIGIEIPNVLVNVPIINRLIPFCYFGAGINIYRGRYEMFYEGEIYPSFSINDKLEFRFNLNPGTYIVLNKNMNLKLSVFIPIGAISLGLPPDNPDYINTWDIWDFQPTWASIGIEYYF